ncbi:flagellar basal body-associated FliL family protein [Poseidonocella sp. HB161398]|uniref:flagellar basal body-associated FliL family protein n=1 Tax=Poseidonocella sp. HB161398 TaxID=2320855 RepID=UPI001F0E0B23|nr:flagellar basal body-associated FliL family protein [Poseidonocella sp. HB161398]
MKFLIPIVIVLAGIGIGGGAGWFFAPEMPECDCAALAAAAEEQQAAEEEEMPSEFEYVDMKNQFVVPVVDGGSVSSMVVMSLSLEVELGAREAVYAKEPKLRDSFLRVLFAYASMGGFNDSFLDAEDMNIIRNDLTQVAKQVLGPIANAVLIVDMVRQDI